MKTPVLQDDRFLADVAAARRDPAAFHLWWLGQSGFLLQWEGRHLLFDPYLSDSLTRKYAGTDKPHTRITARVVDPARLDFIEVVTSSHTHTDHLDPETLGPLRAMNPGLNLVFPEANRSEVCTRLGLPQTTPHGLTAGDSVHVAGFTIHAVPAAHDELEQDAAGRHRFLGYVVEFGPWRVYHSGDTLRYPGMEDWLKRWPIDVALLPINGNRPDRRVAGNLDGREAAALGKAIRARLVIPCHFDMFEFNTADPGEFAAASGRLGQPFCVLQNGQRWSASVLRRRFPSR